MLQGTLIHIDYMVVQYRKKKIPTLQRETRNKPTTTAYSPKVDSKTWCIRAG